MSTETLTDSTEAAILSRVIAPGEATLSPEAAKSLLALSFSDADRRRMDDLAEKARQGALSPGEQAAIANYESVASLIGFLQSKARVSLRKTGTEAK